MVYMSAAESNNRNASSELNAERWSVISFDRVEATGLTYEQAARRKAELDEERLTGLCVVTDEVAARFPA